MIDRFYSFGWILWAVENPSLTPTFRDTLSLMQLRNCKIIWFFLHTTKVQSMMVDSGFSRLSLKTPEGLKRLGLSRDKREWLSDTDLDHLPPLSPVPHSPSPPRKDQFGRLHSPRPPTPSPNMRRVDTFFSGKPRIGPLSPCNSTNRLSLNLDLSPLREGSVTLDRFKRDNSFEKPDITGSPRLCVRSLPTSPVLTRASRPRRPMRRNKSDSEQHNEFTKEDRIIQWIQDVQENRKDDSVCIDAEDLSEFSSAASTSDSSELELGSSPSLPAIQEHSIYNSHPNLS